MRVSKRSIKKFQKEILEWYKKNKRDLPWRVPDDSLLQPDPYKILVSEVMSQQTQIHRVIPKYLEWMKRFPTIESLAKAPIREVLKYWNGLGYNRRALYLQKTAQQIAYGLRHIGDGKKSRKFRNSEIRWPTTEKELKKLPGIGEYTARAILCFAFGKQIAVVDTNVRKVILTKCQISNVKYQISNKEFQEIANQLLPNGKAYEWNQALMDYASAMLKKEKIPIPKQSHFPTSNRFYRGQIIRLLLKKKRTVDSLFESIENNGITREQFMDILVGMEKEGFIQKKAKVYSLR